MKKIWVCIAIILFMSSVLLPPHNVQALGMRNHYIGRRYTLNGRITLTYSRIQTDGTKMRDTFTHRYSLGLGGYIVHPRLMTFGLNTSYSESYGLTEDTWSLYNSIQLNILPYKPLSLSLRYSRVDSNTGNDYNAYGLTLRYYKKVRLLGRGMRALRRVRKEGLVERILPASTVLDIDRIEYSNYINTIASLRLKGRLKKTSYIMSSTHSIDERQNGKDTSRTAISADAFTDITLRHMIKVGGDYAIYNDEDKRTNLYLYGDFSGHNKEKNLFYGLNLETHRYTGLEQTYAVRARATKLRSYPGSLSVSYSAGVHYKSFDGDRYGLSGNLTASKPLSEVVKMALSTGFTIGDIGSAGLSTRLYERLSKRVRLSQYYYLNYKYGSELSEQDRGTSHRIGGSASVRLHRRLFTSASINYFTKHDTHSIGGSASANTWFWRFGLQSGVGASDTTSGDQQYQNYYAFLTIRGNILKSLHMTMDTRYIYRSQDDLRRFIVKPYLTWHWRKLSARLEYEYTTEESNLRNETTTQRLYITITRYFGRVFYR